MGQLVVKDFELHFGKEPGADNSINRSTVAAKRAHEYLNPDESLVPDEAPEVKPFIRKVKNKVLFVQAYLLPLE